MKKIISIFLVLCMMATLLPTVAFATEGDGETVAPIVADFTATTLTNGKTAANASWDGLTTSGFDVDLENSTPLGVRTQLIGTGLETKHAEGVSSLAYLKRTWPAVDSKNLILTINVNAENAGYYTGELVYGKNEACGDFAIYINEQFVGAITDAYDATAELKTDAEPMMLNAVYLEEGKNEISFKCILHRGNRTDSWLLLNKLTLTYCGDDFSPIDFSGNLPTSVKAGASVEFSVSASINENLKKFYATYDEAGTAITNPEGTVTVTSEDGTVALTNQTATGATGTFTANAAGKATLTASTTINGKTYTENFEVDVIGPIVADFTKVNKKQNVTFDEIRAAGIDVVDDKTTAMTKHGGIWFARGLRTTHYTDASSAGKVATWPSTNTKNMMFTFNVTATKEGYYSPVLDYDVCTAGGIYAIYINGQYAGTVNAYNESVTTIPAAEKAKLNTVYLAEGKNEVSYRCVDHGLKGETSWFFIVSLTLTPCDEKVELDVLPEISMSVSTDADYADCITVNGEKQVDATYTYSANVGETVTVVAEDIEGKVFRGWLRGGVNGDPVCPENTYTFTAATNVALYAKYTDAPAESGEVSEYYDWNGEFLGNTDVSSTLSKYGFTFKEWKSAVVNGITRYVADYVTKNTYAITKPSNVNADKDLDSISHETPITLKSETPVSWYINEKLVACGDTYTFLATQAARVLTDSLVTVGPIVNLTKPEGDTYILEYNANGKNVIEKGIIFGEAGASVTSCSYKVISQRNDDFGKLMAENDKNCAKVRGYIIYNDNGTYRVVYADIAE